MFHNSREYLGTLNDLVFVGRFEICGDTFGECSSGIIVNVVQQSYPCIVWGVPLFGFRVGSRIDNVWVPSWATQFWVELGFLILDWNTYIV